MTSLLRRRRFQVMGVIALSATICRNRGLQRLSIAGNEMSQVRARCSRALR
jgi:hypothetical protein